MEPIDIHERAIIDDSASWAEFVAHMGRLLEGTSQRDVFRSGFVAGKVAALEELLVRRRYETGFAHVMDIEEQRQFWSTHR